MKRKFKIKDTWRHLAAVVLAVFLGFSVIYSIIRLISAPAGVSDGFRHVKSDYVLMLVQCGLGLVVMALPSLIQRRWELTIPNYMFLLYYAFLFCAIYLGEVWDFYHRIPFWDLILHAFSGAMLGALGFSLVSMLNEAPNIRFRLSPLFVALFAFCFALAAGTVWEIYEFTVDRLLGLNMQKYMLADGTELVGAAALHDTMEDLIVDAVSALIVSILGYVMLKRQQKTKKSSADTQPSPDVGE
ncbi:MAG: hypothetical protein ACOX1A_03940 [Saccharofermentanales bacterium]|nr:hypothetical protein [Clostridiaceae bacterium]